MIRDRYEPENLLDLIPSLSIKSDPVLLKLDVLLDDDVVFNNVKDDLARRYARTRVDGRPSTPVEVILRMLVVKHLYGWSYEQTEHWVSDSLSLRQFCRVYRQAVPDDTTLIRWANTIRPETLHALLDRVLKLARSLKVTRGRKMRTDGTVVETNIHHPMDSCLLGDGVRVLSRLLKKARPLLTNQTSQAQSTPPETAFRNRTRSAKRQVHAILDATRRRGEQAAQRMKGAYQRLLDTARATVAQAKKVQASLVAKADAAAKQVAEQLQTFVGGVQRVIEQTQRRVLQGESVGAQDKLVSLFETHTAIIRKGKLHTSTQFGREVWLDEVDGGLVSRYEILPGNPAEDQQIPHSLDHHLALFGHPPHMLSGDRGTYSAANETYAQQKGVTQIVLPKPGQKSGERMAHERQPWFRRGKRWRAGIEGRIHVLKRDYGLNRCLNHGEAGMERWVGWGIIAHDLRVIALAQA